MQHILKWFCFAKVISFVNYQIAIDLDRQVNSSGSWQENDDREEFPGRALLSSFVIRRQTSYYELATLLTTGQSKVQRPKGTKARGKRGRGLSMQLKSKIKVVPHIFNGPSIWPVRLSVRTVQCPLWHRSMAYSNYPI